jgi:hypothetical protein
LQDSLHNRHGAKNRLKYTEIGLLLFLLMLVYIWWEMGFSLDSFILAAAEPYNSQKSCKFLTVLRIGPKAIMDMAANTISAQSFFNGGYSQYGTKSPVCGDCSA